MNSRTGTPIYQQRTRAPRAAQMPTVQPGPATPLPNFEAAGAAIAANIAAVQQRAEQSAFMTAETNIAQQKSYEAGRLREIETLPSADVAAATDELEKESREAWGQIRSKAGERGRVRHTVDMMAEGHEAEVAERLNRIRATAHGVLTAEKFDAAIANRARAVEANPESYSRNLAEAIFNADHSLVDQRAQSAMRAEISKTLAMAALRGAVEKDAAAVAADLKAENPKAPYIAALGADVRAQILPHVEKTITDDRAKALTDTISGQFRKAGPDAGQRALQALEASSESEEVKDRVRTEVRARSELLRVERRQEHKDQIIAVQRAIASDRAGATTERAVHRLYALGALSTDEYASTLASIDRSVLSQAKSNAAATEIASALASGLPLDPSDKDHRKGLAAMFAATLTDAAPPGTGPWRERAQAFAKKARMLPDQAIAWTRQAMRSPNTEFAATAAQFFGAVALETPDALNHPDFDHDTKAFAGLVNSMIQAGASPADAVETARGNVFELTSERRQARVDAWKSVAKGNDNANALSKYIDALFDPGWFTAQPEISDSRAALYPEALNLQEDFDAQAREYFLRTGDPVLARKLAWADLQRVFGPSRVNGEPFMFAFPPERYGVKPEEVRAEIGEILLAHPQAGVSSAEEIVVVPDAVTLRQVRDVISGKALQPTYALITPTGDRVIDDQGIPLRYTLPGGQELSRRIREAEDAADARAKSQIEEGRMAREKLLRSRQELTAAGIALGRVEH
jgi:hypothetical protein